MSPFLLMRVYLLENGSNQIMSPVLKPIITSRQVGLRVRGLMSWQRGCALVNRILVRGSCWVMSVSYPHPNPMPRLQRSSLGG